MSTNAPWLHLYVQLSAGDCPPWWVRTAVRLLPPRMPSVPPTTVDTIVDVVLNILSQAKRGCVPVIVGRGQQKNRPLH